MKIRPYHQSDLTDVLIAWDAASRLAHPFLNEQFLIQERKNIQDLYLPNADTWVAEVDDTVVGFISLVGNEVGGLFLHPDHHGKGLGRALMDKARSLHNHLELEVFVNNRIGRNFYARYGFVLMEEKIHAETGLQVLRLNLS